MIVFQMDGDHPTAVSQVSGATAPAGTLECTKAQAAEFRDAGPYLPGGDATAYRFTFVGGVLSEVTDGRPRVTWGDPGGVGTVDGEGNVALNLDEGDAEPNVSLTLPGTATRTDRIKLDNGQTLKLDFVNGVATIPVRADAARRLVITKSDTFRMANRLTVRVNAVKL